MTALPFLALTASMALLYLLGARIFVSARFGILTAALFALNAVAGSHRTCGKVKPAELRRPADPDYAKTLERLARCGR